MNIYALNDNTLKPILRQLHDNHSLRVRRRIGKIEVFNSKTKLQRGDILVYHKQGLFYEFKFLGR